MVKQSLWQWANPMNKDDKSETFNMVEATAGAMNSITDSYYTRLAKLESNNDLGVVNRLGYAGRYQMGAGALVDTGYLKKEAYSKGNKSMREPSMWTGKDGIYSLEQFLANEAVQEAAVRNYTNRNRIHLTSNKIGDKTVLDAAKELGIDAQSLLGSAHLLGAEGIKNYVSDLYNLNQAIGSDSPNATAIGEVYDRLSGYKDANGKTAADRIKEFGGSVNVDFEKVQSFIPTATPDTGGPSLTKLPSIGEPIQNTGAVQDSLLSSVSAQGVISQFDPTKINNPMGNKKLTQTSLDKASNAALATNIGNIGASIVGGIYSMHQVNNMKAPDPISPEVVEAVKIGDRGAALAASGQSSIDRGIATSRNALQRAGRADMLPTLTAAESGATNQLSGSVEQMRLQIDQMNAAAEARAREINASAKTQAGLFNSQTLQAFQQMKSQLGTQAISTMGQNVSANASAISSNAFGKAMYEDQTKKQDKSIYMSMLSSPDKAIQAQGLAGLKELMNK